MKMVYKLLSSCILAIMFAGCVHEFPTDGEPRNVVLHFHHESGWTYHDVNVSRSGVEKGTSAAGGVHARYHLMFYPAGLYEYPVLEKEIRSADLAREDFDEAVMLPPGNYDLFLWSDYADAELKKSFFFDSGDHANITYRGTYSGNNELRDAFRAYVSFNVQSNVDANYREDVTVNIERPLARYEIIATDFNEFIQREVSRAQMYQAESRDLSVVPQSELIDEIGLSHYKVKVKYTGYMPNCFNNFSNSPVDAQLGVSYDAVITPLSEDEARIGFDYVMVNGHESSVKVAVEIYNANGDKIATSSSFDIPTKRSQNTAVRGRFLTSSAQQGVSIDPTFEGQYDVYL